MACKKCQNTRKSIASSIKKGNATQAIKKVAVGVKRILRK